MYKKIRRQYAYESEGLSERKVLSLWAICGFYAYHTMIHQLLSSTSYCRFGIQIHLKCCLCCVFLYLFILIFRDGWMRINVSSFCHSVFGWFSHQTNSMRNPRKSWRAQIGMCDCVIVSVCVYVAGNIRSCELEQACRVIKSKCEYVI